MFIERNLVYLSGLSVLVLNIFTTKVLRTQRVTKTFYSTGGSFKISQYTPNLCTASMKASKLTGFFM